MRWITKHEAVARAKEHAERVRNPDGTPHITKDELPLFIEAITKLKKKIRLIPPAEKKPRHHDMRIITKFVWFPYCINGENRWIETISVRQFYIEQKQDTHDSNSSCEPKGYWKDIAFTTEDYGINWSTDT